MFRLLADVNLDGHFRRLSALLEGDPLLNYFWSELPGSVLLTFNDLGWDGRMSDVEVWRRCQAGRLILVTANRNSDGKDSLEATIRRENAADCLPIFTIGDAREFLKSSEYAYRVAARLLDYLEDLPGILGSGRIYIP